MAVSNAISKLLINFGLDNSSIKWPNDIYIGDKKVAGILIENSIQTNLIATSVIGIGINVNEVDFPDYLPNPTSIKSEKGQDLNLDEFSEHVFLFLEEEYLLLKRGEFNSIKHYYQQHMYRYQEEHFFEIQGQKKLATIMGVNEFGSLVLNINNSLKDFQMKELKFLIS